MELIKALELSAAILVSLGGGAAIVFGFSSWLGKVWASRMMEKERSQHANDLESLKNKLLHDAESYKIKLRKSEFIFQKEYEAVSEFVALKWNTVPEYNRPGMDWHEACDEIADNLHNIECSLRAYLAKHAAVLPESAQKLISESIMLSGNNKFGSSSGDIQKEANEAAAKLHGDEGTFSKIEDILIEKVHSQSST